MRRERNSVKSNPTCKDCAARLDVNNWPPYLSLRKQYLCSPCASRRQKVWQATDKERTRRIQSRHRRTLKRVVWSAKRSATARGLAWSLTEEEVRSLRSGGCVYCSRPVPETGSGLDRLDNSLGYVIGNVVPSCTEHNLMRGDRLTPEETMIAVRSIEGLRAGYATMEKDWQAMGLKRR